MPLKKDFGFCHSNVQTVMNILSELHSILVLSIGQKKHFKYRTVTKFCVKIYKFLLKFTKCSSKYLVSNALYTLHKCYNKQFQFVREVFIDDNRAGRSKSRLSTVSIGKVCEFTNNNKKLLKFIEM